MAVFTGHDLGCLRGERMVFAHLDFAVRDGGALFLTGANGSGKSSLLRLMAGLLRPAVGRMAWDDATVSPGETHNARLHFVGHSDTVKPVLTTAENLRFWARMRGHEGTVDTALAAFGIAHLADVPGRFLSAGQRRKVNLARILAAPAPLWLLDEPTTALDADGVRALEAALARHRADGGVAVIATHSGIDAAGAEALDIGRFALPWGTAA